MSELEPSLVFPTSDLYHPLSVDWYPGGAFSLCWYICHGPDDSIEHVGGQENKSLAGKVDSIFPIFNPLVLMTLINLLIRVGKLAASEETVERLMFQSQ